MENLINRLASFATYPHNTNVKASAMACAGLYYAGIGDMVKCFRCHMTLQDWLPDDDPLLKHKLASPECPLVIGYDENNNAKTNKKSALDSQDKPYDCTDSAASTQDDLNALRSTLFGNSEFSQTLESIRNRQLNPKLHSKKEISRELIDETESGVEPTGCGQNEPVLPELTDCGENLPVVSDLTGDAPRTGHFGTDRSSAAASQLTEGQPLFSTHDQDVPDDPRQELTNAPLHKDSALHAKSKHPQYAAEARRLATFKGFEANFRFAKSSPSYLAEAGFYCQGVGDSVRCFYCDGGLKDFEPDDDPWTEHVRWFPSCHFVLERKDMSFIRTVQQRGGNAGTAAAASSQGSVFATDGCSSTARRDANGLYHVDPREVKARMESPKVRLIIDMGYSRDIVKQAIENRLRTVGDDFDNAQGLLQSIFNMENAKAALDYNPAKAAKEKKSAAAQSSASARMATPPHASLPTMGLMGGASYMPLAGPERGGPSVTATAAESLPTAGEGQTIAGESATDGAAVKAITKKQKKKQRAAAAANVAAASQLVELTLDTETQELLKENNQLREARTCKVCLDKEVNTVYLPCGHLVCCDECSPALKNCPVCRALIRGTVKVMLT